MFGQSPEPLVLTPTSISAEAGKEQKVVVGIRNTGTSTQDLKYTVELSGTLPSTLMKDKTAIESWLLAFDAGKTITLKSGERVKKAISIIVPTGSSLGTYQFAVTLQRPNDQPLRDSFTITVK